MNMNQRRMLAQPSHGDDMHRTLHQLAQQQGLNPQQTQALWQLAGVHRPQAGVHRRLRQVLALVAALLLGAGLIFWVAANWDAQSRMFKLQLLQAAVAAPLLVAVLLPGRQQVARMALALLGTLAVGGLLAYIGITYQTGADAWQLFATWALLVLPMVLVLRSDWLWAAWLLIVATAIGAWSGRLLFNPLAWHHLYNLMTSLLWLAVFVAPLLCERLGWVRNQQGQPVQPRISIWLATLCAVGAWGVRGIYLLFGRFSEGWIPAGYVMHVLLVLCVFWVGWRSRWRDLLVLSVAVLALDVLGLSLLAKWMMDWETQMVYGFERELLLLFALAAAAVVGLSGRWLYQQQRQARAERAYAATVEGEQHGN